MRTTRRVIELFGITAMVCLCIVPYQAKAADLDGSTPVLCAFTSGAECDSTSGCEGTTAESLGLPQFFRIDFPNNVITGVQGGDGRKTSIRDFQRLDGKLMLQGIEIRGWSMVITEKTGKLTLTASGDDEAFVLFGACIPQ
jgi:hypothetical protein